MMIKERGETVFWHESRKSGRSTSCPRTFPNGSGIYQPTVYRYVRFRLANREAAEDVTSQVFMKALRALDRYDPGPGLPEDLVTAGSPGMRSPIIFAP